MTKKQLLNRLDGLFAKLEKGKDGFIPEQIDQAPGWSWECDSQGIITACSPEVKYILGLPAEDFIGNQVGSVHLTPDSAFVLSSALQSENDQDELELDYIANNGDILRTTTTIIPTHDEISSNSLHGWRGSVSIRPEPSLQKSPAPASQFELESDTAPIIPGQPATGAETLKLSGYLADGSQVLLADKILTDVGEESIQFQRTLYKNAAPDEPAVLAVPTSYRDGGKHLLLEIIDNHAARRWSEDELLLVEQVADQLSLALNNAQLFEQTQLRAEELSILRQVSLELARQQHDLQSVLEIINRRAVELLSAHSAAIWIWDANLGRLEMKNVYLSGEDGQFASTITADDELPELAFHNRKTLVVKEYTPWKSTPKNRVLDYPSPAIAIPLEWQAQVVGTLLICRERDDDIFSSNERHLAELFAGQAAAVIQNALLFDQTQSALEETDLLYKASGELNASLSYQDILDILRNYTILGANSSEVTIIIYDHPWDRNSVPEWYDQIACWSSETGYDDTSRRYALSSIPYASRILKASSPTIIEELTKDMRLGTATQEMYINRYKARSLLFAPLNSAGQWIGHITAIYQQPTQFTDSAVRRLSALAGQAAFVVQNLRLLDETRRRAEELQTAAEIARDTTGTLSLDTLLNRAAQLIRERFYYYHTTIFLLDERGSYAFPRASTSKYGTGESSQMNRVAVGSNSVIGYVTQVGESLLVNDISQDPLRLPNPLLPETRAELGIPLKIGDRVIGALDVQSTRVNAFTHNDSAVLQILADQIAVAVENARSYEISLQAMEEMRKADQLKSQFLANMSHELRTPLNSIIGFSRVILKGIDGPINDTQQQDLQAIYSSGQHLLSLINDILDLSKIEAGKMELSFEDRVDIRELIQSVLSTAKGLVKDKPIEIISEIDPDLPLIRADPLKIRQVLLNLLSNAAKFTDHGSITIKAEQYALSQDFQHLKISVIDTGHGISLEDQKKLFLPFSQVDASPTRKTGGSGLGLSICRHLIEMHHGEIGVESEVGVGSTFYFILPESTASGLSSTADYSSPSRTIICIESDTDVIQLYERYLQPHGYRALPFTNPDQALEAARRIQPLVITLDIGITAADGWHVLHTLKNDPSTNHLPVIICTVKDERAKAISSGADGYLLKPILEEDFVNMIQQFESNGKHSEDH